MALTEIIASWLAYGRDGHGPTFTSRVPQMAFYGAFVSAPLTHLLNGTLQKKFAGRTGAGNLLLQTLLTYIFVCRPFHDGYQMLTFTDLPYPEHRVSSIHGSHRWSAYHRASPRGSSRWTCAHDHCQLRLVPCSAGIRQGFCASSVLGTIFQYGWVLSGNLLQHFGQEEKGCCRCRC